MAGFRRDGHIYRIRGNFRRSCISRKASLKDFRGLIFADHQVENIVFLLSHCFFSRIKISHSSSLQRNPHNLRPSKITAYTVCLQWM